jgi:hypothetical protein
MTQWRLETSLPVTTTSKTYQFSCVANCRQRCIRVEHTALSISTDQAASVLIRAQMLGARGLPGLAAFTANAWEKCIVTVSVLWAQNPPSHVDGGGGIGSRPCRVFKTDRVFKTGTFLLRG